MKRFYLSLLALLTLFAASAEHLSPEQALARLQSSSMRRAPAKVAAMKSLTTLPGLYVFSSEAGYVVLPADDAAPALLGYSDSGAFDPIANPALAWWLNTYSRQLRYAAEVSAPPREMLRISRPAISPMLSTRWNQGDPYNADCPELDGQRCVTGCVATAMAQVLRYHSWPTVGTGTHSYTWEDGGKELSFDYSATTFLWNEMTDTYSSSSTAAQKAAVATLMYAAGVSVDMSYTPSESGASSGKIGPALINYFNYDKALWMPERQYYGLDEWEKMVYDELAAGRPVLYGGTGSAGGHQFVCDGYSADGYFHFNWGWGGLSDGYFLLTALDPPSLGIGGGAGGFNYNQGIVVGVQPPVEGSTPHYLFYCSEFAPAVAQTALGSAVEFGSGFFNYGITATPADSRIGIEIRPVEPTPGVPVYVVSNVGSLEPDYGFRTIRAALPADLAEGTYTIKPAYKTPDEEWQIIRAPLSANGSVTATVSGSQATFSTPDVPKLTVSDLALATPLYWGSPFLLNFTVENPGDTEYYGGLIPALVSTNGESESLVATATTYPIDLVAGDSQHIEYSGKFSASEVPAAGSYNLVLLNSAGAVIGGPVAVTLNAAAATAEVRVASFTLPDGDPSVGSSEVKFNVEAECVSGYFASHLTVAVFTLSGGTSKAVGSTGTYYLEAGKSGESSATLDLSALEAGQYMAGVFNGQSFISDRLIFDIKDDKTAIEEVNTPDIGDPETPLFDLQGRRVSPDDNLSGIYITTGRKILLVR